jgi:hypothetical protein
MKALLWQGHRIDTNDEVADAAFELARLLVGAHATERIDVPAEVHGHATTFSLVVGGTLGLGMIALPDEPDHPLPGSEDAVRELHARIARLDVSTPASGFRLPDDFTVLDHDITSGPGDVLRG